KEMQRLLSSSYGLGKACVGQACRQSSQLPQFVLIGVSYVRGRFVTISARKTQEPQPFVRTLVFLPYQPNPARWATARSTMRPVSTNKRVSMSSLISLRAYSRSHAANC